MIEYRNSEYELIVISNVEMNIHVDEIKRLFVLFRDLMRDIPDINYLEFKQITPPALVFNYRFTTTTALTWDQIVTFDSYTDNNPICKCAFDKFHLNQVKTLVALLELLIKIVNNYQLQTIEIIFF